MTLSPFAMLQLQFLLLSTAIIIAVDTVILGLAGRGGWLAALRAACLGAVPFYVVIFGFLVMLQSSLYQRTVGWTMVMGLPLIGFFLMLIGAWAVKMVLQCWICGLSAG